MKPEDRERLDELSELKKNLWIEISSRTMSQRLDARFKFKDCTLDELIEWNAEVHNKIEAIIAPYERGNDETCR